MLWKRPPKESVDILNLVRVNDRVQLSFRGRDYLSRVEDVQGQDIFAAVPMSGGSPVPMKAGEAVTINTFVESGIWSFSGVVKDYVAGRVPYVILSGLKDKGRVQRREYVRVADKQDIRYRKDGDQASMQPWCRATMTDISGGGVQLVGDGEGIAEGVFLDLELVMPGFGPISAIARVVRAWKSPGAAGSYHAGAEFVQIHPGDRRTIVQYVQKKQTELISRRHAA